MEAADADALLARLQPMLGWTGEARWKPIMTGWEPDSFSDSLSAPDVLRHLVECRGVSGHEAPVRDVIRQRIAWINPEWTPVEDAAGNLVLTLGDGPQTCLLTAHMDEIGLEVTKIRDDGCSRRSASAGCWTTSTATPRSSW